MKKFQIINWKLNRGFSLIELLVAITIFSILIGIVTLNLNTAQQNTSIESTVDTLLADLSQQQIKAMVGDTEGRGTISDYGIHITTNGYTLFFGTYSTTESSNFFISLPATQQITTTFPNNQIIFIKGNGELSGFVADQNTITVSNTVGSDQKVIQLNRYGVVTGIN